ncbi:uncharacterized protein LOC113099798 [Carassius auratus]|uniref:Uncharacterized protein LOC113099798 n=1 Tax=Carassius auratus TaxID=7957 RepID=A0A6P6PJJ1_CARAU|nr:uncharacterized protein LOC113099798 [Carassius auratus]
MEGESVTLHTDITEIQRDDEIEWRFNSIRIATANIPEYNDERFRDRLKLDQTGSLTITNTRTTDSGEYKLSIIAGNKDITKRFNVIVHVRPSTPTITPQNPSSSDSAAAVTASGPQTPSHSPDSVPLTVLISAAAAGFLLIVVAVVIFWICWKKRPEQEGLSVTGIVLIVVGIVGLIIIGFLVMKKIKKTSGASQSLGIVKGELRSSMGQERLSMLELMSIEHELLLRSLYFTDTIEEFALAKSRKTAI